MASLMVPESPRSLPSLAAERQVQHLRWCFFHLAMGTSIQLYLLRKCDWGMMPGGLYKIIQVPSQTVAMDLQGIYSMIFQSQNQTQRCPSGIKHRDAQVESNIEMPKWYTFCCQSPHLGENMFVTSNPCWACDLQHPKPLGAGKVPSGCQGLVHSHTTIQVPIFLDMYIYIYT